MPFRFAADISAQRYISAVRYTNVNGTVVTFTFTFTEKLYIYSSLYINYDSVLKYNKDNFDRGI